MAMKTRAASISLSMFVPLAAVALAGAACGREMESAPAPVSTTSLTAAEVVAGAPPQTPEDSEEASCVEPIGDPVVAYACAHPDAETASTNAPAPAAPATAP